MYNLSKLLRVASTGLKDMGPALRAAFTDQATGDRLALVYGPNPRTTLIALAAIAAVLGEWFARAGPELPFRQYLDWPAVFVALPFAILLRRYLFQRKPTADDYPWLAASLIPPVVICLAISPLATLLFGAAPDSGLDAEYRRTALGEALMWITGEIGIAAAFTIALAALCYSRDWLRALMDLAVRLLVFRIMIWVTALVLIEIGIVGRLIGGVLNALFGWSLPEWAKVLADQVSYASLLTLAYLAIIGGTWTVCRRSFAELLSSGHVDVIAALEAEAQPPKPEQETPSP